MGYCIKEVNNINIEEYEKYLSLFILIIFAVLSFFLIKPFISSILTAVVLAYVFHPLFKKISKLLKRDWAAALIIAIMVVLVVILPFIMMLNTLTSQTIGVYNSVSTYLDNNEDTLETFYKNIEDRFGVAIDLENIIGKSINFITDTTASFLKSLPQKIINFFIIIFLLYYLLKDGKKISKNVASFLPIKKNIKKKLGTDIKELTNAVIYGLVLTALIQGMIGAIGFVVFGISSPIFWGMMMAIFALIPFLGTAVIWVPAALYLLIKGIVLNNGWLIGKGVGLFIYGILIVSMIDNFIKPKLIGTRSNIHPAIILLGILGGLSLFGFIGIVIGPIIFAVFISIVKIYCDENAIQS